MFYGYFQEQGNHSEWGLSYVALMAIHEFGTLDTDKGNIPPRPVFSLTLKTIENSSTKKTQLIKPSLKQYFTKLEGSTNVDKALSGIGQNFVKETSGNFGTSILLPNKSRTISKKGFDKPLIWTGELQSNLAYKTSTGGKVATGYA